MEELVRWLLSPDGKEVAVIARGEVFVTSIDGAITKRVTQTPATERFLNFHRMAIL